MVNDITTLNGALSQLGETMATNITAKGVSASASDGLTTLAGKILQISGDTPTPPTPTVLFEDACDSASGLSNYGTVVDIKRTGAAIEMTYDSTENAYKINPTSYHTGEVALIPIPVLQNMDNYQISFQGKHNSTVVQNQMGIFIYDSTLSSKTAYGIRRMGNGQMTTHIFSQSTDNGTNSVTYNTNITTQYFTFTMIKEGNNLQFIVKDENDTERYNQTFSASGNNDSIGLYAYCWDNTRDWYIKNIKAESLGGGSECSQYTQQIEDAIAYINGDGT